MRLPIQYAEGWPEDNAIYRRARKLWTCHGDGGGGEHRHHSDACAGVIRPGEFYVEFVGETPAYQKGSAHSIACAINYGYITKRA